MKKTRRNRFCNRSGVALMTALGMAASLIACSPAASNGSSAPGSQSPVVSAPEGSSDKTTPAPGNSASEEKDDGVYDIGIYCYMAGTAIADEIPIAVQLALEDYGNEVNGCPVKVTYYETQNNPEEAVKGAQYLIGLNVDAVIGSFQSADVAPCIPLLEEAKIVNVSMATSGSLMKPDLKYGFRGSFNADMAAPTVVDWCKELGYQNIAVFYGQDEASIANHKAILPLFEAAGMTVSADETGTQNDTDFSSQCLKIVNAKPDVVYVVCAGAGVNFVKQLREYGYNGIILNKDEWMTSHVDTVGETNSNYVGGAIAYTTYKSVEAAKEAGARDSVVEFCQRFYDATGNMPQVGITYRAYDSMCILLEGAKRAKTITDDAAIAAAIEGIGDMYGCCGPIDFTGKDREPCHEFMRVMYDGGSKTFEIWQQTGGYDAFKKATGREK